MPGQDRSLSQSTIYNLTVKAKNPNKIQNWKMENVSISHKPTNNQRNFSKNAKEKFITIMLYLNC
jgi:hypothetical protein